MLAVVSAAPTAGPAGASTPQGDEGAPSTRPPEVLFKKPWATKESPEGQFTHIHQPTGLQFGPVAGVLARHGLHLYDDRGLDVGVDYRGAYAVGSDTCLCTLTVFVYPRTESLEEHFPKVEQEFLASNPDAVPHADPLRPEQITPWRGRAKSFSHEIDGIRAIEEVTSFAHGDWFVSFRITLGPGPSEVCAPAVVSAIGVLRGKSERE